MEQALRKFFESHEDNSPPTENEYINNDDGLKYCKICNSPKQCKITFQGEETIVACTCKCVDEVQNKIDQAKQLQRVNDLKRNITDTLYHKMTFEKSDTEIKFAKKYVENFEKYKKENIGLMLIGDKGTGKTYAAACIANALCENLTSVYMANVLYLTQQLGDFNAKNETLDKIRKCQLLIVDDIGAERQTDYMCEQVYNIIETRYRANKPLVITSNITLDQLKKCDDIRLVRTYDRLKEMCHPIVMSGNSRRIKKANDRFLRVKAELEG